MISIKRITTNDQQYYSYMVDLLTTAFPIEEYRDLDVLREYTDTLPIFHCNIIFCSNTPIGLVTYWDLDHFYYIEHFAIDPNQRNGGYGRKLLSYLSEFLNKPIVLEVEYPTEEIAKRRINFYQREGYTLWENEYFQPPYRVGQCNLPMYLMVQGKLDPQTDFDNVRTKIYSKVYNYSVE